jgi:hypothetical protein
MEGIRQSRTGRGCARQRLEARLSGLLAGVVATLAVSLPLLQIAHADEWTDRLNEYASESQRALDRSEADLDRLEREYQAEEAERRYYSLQAELDQMRVEQEQRHWNEH